ncbi:hypothetical protein FOZ61_001688 [Perkinsus olseni]|uniref:Uncharacterized protein n=1 Tax=Perkinsus olseni TaxID=32597 RepID=A0A7J6MCI9_PEROL|nr:hypothetical protein FOZ61_001688 [Perkinsus olseni]KAF4669096.1 hypothetical protein FOL46_001627 [Perkinsus olseni]
MASNNSGYTGFATLELAVMLASNSSPVDVGVWADGKTIWLFNLPAGISVGVELSIPTFSKTDGYDFNHGKEITFLVFLKTRVTVPFFGTVRAESNGTAYASVDTTDGWHSLVVTVFAEGTIGAWESGIVFTGDLVRSTKAFQPWHCTGYVDIGTHGRMDALRIAYNNRFPVFEFTV